MNLVDFYVLEILDETRGPAYELYGRTRAWAEKQEPESWREKLLGPGVRQVYKENCYGHVSVRTRVFFAGERPYYAGYKGAG